MQAAECRALSYHVMQSIYRLFILGLKIRTISVSNDFSTEKEDELIALSQKYEKEHKALITTGIPLQQAISITYRDESYLFTIHETKTTYQKSTIDHDINDMATCNSIAVA